MLNENKYVLITGATSGIGYELAKLFAKDGYNLVIVSRNQQELESKASEFRQYGTDVIAIQKDLFKTENVFELYEEIRNKGISIDVLVNNAAQGAFGEFKDTDINRELAIINLNIASVVILTKCFLKEMIARNNGKILNLASVASKAPGPWQAVYHGTKAFVLSFTEAIREETKDYNIAVTALMPGVTDTDFFNKAGMTESRAVQDKEAMSDPAEVAKDGFDALMANKDKIVSGFKNKLQVSMGNIIPDDKLAGMMAEQQKPVDEK